MNKIFSIVWNHAQQAWVVTSELASKRGKRSGLVKKALTILVGGAVASIAQASPPASNALPTGGQVVAGQVDINQSNNTLNIQQSTQTGIINWNTFNIGTDATVNFQQPNSSSATLNRVMSSDASKIYGQLNANGQVFLINPNGVLFGKNARVDVGGLVASTMNIRDQDFLSGNYEFNADGATGSVINEGELLGNYIAMLAPEVRNEGVVIARQGTVAMAAGQKVTLSIAGDHLINVQVEKADFDTLVENRHLVEVEGGLVIMSAQSASQLLGKTVNSGQVSAAGISNDGGVVRLLASSEIEHSGSINVNAGEQGQGGSAILLADLDNPNSKTNVSGSISAQGGTVSGDGGFIETSASQVQIADSASINTHAANGETGQWLLDPVDFTIGVNGDMSAATLVASLGTSNVTIQSVNGSSGSNGDIFVNDSLSWNTNALTLSADRHIEINAPISVTGGGGLNLEFGQASSAGDFLNFGNYFISAPVDLAAGTSFTTKFGNDGATINYTVITDEAGLLAVDSGMTGNYVLGADISVVTNPWNPLGNATGDFAFGTTAFTGILDGLGHTIDGLTRTNTVNSTGIGLFGQIGDQFTPGGLVQNLGLTNVNLAGLSEVGALAGANFGIVNNVYSTGTVTGSDVVGANNDSIVAGIGGLIGTNGGLITNSYAAVNVTATTGDQSFGDGADGGAGGLVGINFSGGIDSSYATGSVSGKRDVGGLVGYSDTGISGSYSSGAVSGTTNVGGFVGDVFTVPFGPPIEMSNSYWNVTTSGQASDGGTGSVGLTDAQAKLQASYTGFDFTSTWIMYDGISQPLLRSMLTPYIVTAEDQTSTYDGTTFGGFTSAASLSVQPAVVTGTLAFSGAATTATDAGTYAISVSGLDLTNAGKVDQHGYYLAYVDGSYTIDKANLSVQVANDTKTYDGLAYSGGNGVSYSGFVNSEDDSVLSGTLSFGGDSQGAINAGGYTISASGLSASNYNLNYVDGALTVDKADLTVTANDDTKTYDALAYNGGNGASYSGFVAAEDDSVLGGTLSFGGDSQGAINAGAYTITASGLSASNYNLNYVDGSLTVDKADLTVTANDDTKTYDALAYTGDNGVSYSGFVAAEDDSVLGGTLSIGGDSQGAINAGSYTLTVGGLSASNYNLNYVDGSLTVDKADLTVTANDDTKTYDGLAYTGDNGVSYSGFVAAEDDTVLGGTLSIGGDSQGAINAGSYALTASGLSASNYNLNYVDGSLTVAKADLTVTANNDTKTYDGLAYTGGNGVGYAGFVNNEDDSALGGTLSYTGNSQGAINAGSYTITATGLTSNNYTITFVDGGLTVDKAALTVTANNETKTYDGLAYSGGNGASYSGFVTGDDASDLGGTLTYAGDSQGAINAGSYTITASGLTSGNYTITFVDGELTVGKATLTVTADDKSITEGDALPALTVSYSGFANNETLGTSDVTGAGSASTEATEDSAVGDYDITAETGTLASNNYTFNLVDGTLTIASSTPETPNSPDDPQLETAVEIIQDTLDKNKGGSEGEGQTQTKLDTNKDKKDPDQTENQSPKEIIQNAADKHCEDCKVSDDLDLSGNNKQAQLTKAANDAKKVAQEAAKNTETKSAQAAKTKQQAELAQKAADEDPTNPEKQRAAEQAVKKAEEANDALIKATADQYVKAKEAAQKQIEVEQGGPDARTEKIDKILKAVQDRGLAVLAAWASMGTDLTKTEEENARKKEELKKYMAAGEDAQKFLETQDQDTVMRVVQLADDLNKADNAKRELEEVQKKAKETQGKLDVLTAKSKELQEALDKANKEAEENPDSPELVLKARELGLQASQVKVDLIEATLDLADDNGEVQKKKSDLQSAEDNANVTKTGVAVYLAEKDQKDAEEKADQQAQESVNKSMVAGFFGVLADITEDASNKSPEAREAAEKKAKEEQKQAEEDAKVATKKAALLAEKAKNVPEKAAIMAQLGHLKSLLEKLNANRNYFNVKGAHNDAAKAAYQTLIETYQNADTMDLATMQKQLASIKDNAQKGLAIRSEYDEYNQQDNQFKKDYLDASFDLKVALLPSNLNQIGTAAADRAAREEVQKAKQKALDAQNAAQKAAEDAEKAKAAVAEAIKNADKNAVELQEKARVLAELAELAKQESDNAKASLAAAENAAKKAAADSAAANYVKVKAEAELAANAKANAERELADAKARVAQRTELAAEIQAEADDAVTKASAAKQDAQKYLDSKAQWEKTAKEKAAQVPVLEQKVVAVKKDAADKLAAAKAVDERWKVLDSEIDRMEPGVQAAGEAKLAAEREYLAAKKAREDLAFSMPSGGDILTLGIQVYSEVDKSSKKEAAQSRLIQAEAAFNKAKAEYESKYAALEAKVNAANATATEAQTAYNVANEAAVAEANAINAMNLAKAEKQQADANTKIFADAAKEMSDYAQDMTVYANNVQGRANTAVAEIDGANKAVQEATMKSERAAEADTKAKTELANAKAAADDAAKIAKEAQ